MIKNEREINGYSLKIDYFQLMVLYKNDLRVFASEKIIGVKSNKHFKMEKTTISKILLTRIRKMVGKRNIMAEYIQD